METQLFTTSQNVRRVSHIHKRKSMFFSLFIEFVPLCVCPLFATELFSSANYSLLLMPFCTEFVFNVIDVVADFNSQHTHRHRTDLSSSNRIDSHRPMMAMTMDGLKLCAAPAERIIETNQALARRVSCNFLFTARLLECAIGKWRQSTDRLCADDCLTLSQAKRFFDANRLHFAAENQCHCA